MKQLSKISEIQQLVEHLRSEGKRIGLVPTMGALHAGHLSLMKIAKAHSDVAVMTIFVNPAQFAPNEDFTSYPRDLRRDAKLAESAGTDILFVPSAEEVYPAPFHTFVHVEQLTAVLEGTTRPTHFRGVTTVVAKLFNICLPHVAVFGQKDAQQALIIRKMVKDLNIPVEVMIGPIVREADGLAMSSRNAYLSQDERAQSTILSRSLRLAEELVKGRERQASAVIDAMKSMIAGQPLANIDYVSINEYATLNEVTALVPGAEILISLAVRFGKTRLIDNTILSVP